ncbi:type II toxin-antitoxin system RelE/ParE family toxin [Aquimarina agarilytica]|uniref:type II toxin-antitoxin system RelE/ParE family toxin n=1 Tax=Aquimarina agarilytica TaxID=1087449 RepID=UPI000289B1E6|nr:type II toxin-antitoxin system RelE/ParE family toxin [Aquimarina agarilytica]
MSKYKLTNKATEDLTLIWDYTFEVWSEKQADKYYNELVLVFNEIALNPTLGRPYNQVKNKLLGVKSGRHIIFYEIINSDYILIERVLHQRMDLKNRILK